MKNTTKLLAGSLFLLAMLATALPAHATPIVEYLLTSDHCTGGCGTAPFGIVTLEQNGLNLDITVHLYNDNLFVKTGAADFKNFKFNGVGIVLGDITVDQTVPTHTLVASAGAFNGDGTGEFGFAIACSTCGNGAGAGNAFAEDIVFHIANASIADVTVPNNLGNVFVADIYSQETGNTGPVDATTPREVPEPNSLLLLGVAVSGLGLLSRARMKR